MIRRFFRQSLLQSQNLRFMVDHRIYTTSVARVYPHYIDEVEKKGRTQQELEQVVLWLTGYTAAQLTTALQTSIDFETLFTPAPLPPDGCTLHRLGALECDERIASINSEAD